MAPKIFLTGATGYVGGDALFALYAAHPEYEYTLLVRNQARADPVIKAFPDAKNIHFVFGENDSFDVISAAAAAADVVLHTGWSADDVPSAKAIVDGLVKGHSASHPGVYIHTSGTGILTWYDSANKRYGQPLFESETYNDYDSVERLVHGLPDTAPHRDVDKIVQEAAAANPDTLRAAIVAPPTIYGQGRGPGNQRSMQVPSLVEYLLTRGYAPVIEPGHTIWDNVHVHDLSDFYVLLVDAGLDPARRDANLAGAHQAPGGLFGTHAYYFVQNGTHKWADVAEWVAEAAAKQGFVQSAADAVKQVPFAEPTAKGAPGTPGINATWGLNSHGEAERAHKLLGWVPKARSLKADIPELVTLEAERAGVSAK